jgi:omega-amidase
MNIQWEDKPANYAAVERLLDSADPREGDLVILPEMFDTGFSFNVERTADRDSATLRFLIRIAEDLGIYIMGGRTIHPCHTCLAHNRAAAISPAGDLLADYSKIHPFSYSKESERFEGGNEVTLFTWTAPQPAASRGPALAAAAGRPAAAHGRPSTDTDNGNPLSLRICPTICYDLRFPELFRLGMLRGAELFTCIANWPQVRQEHWRALLVARAIENQAFVLGVNRTGADPHLQYAGGSIALGPKGEVLGELGDEEAVLTVNIDPKDLHAWRRMFPALSDVRLIFD